MHGIAAPPTPRFTSLQQPLPNFRGRLCRSAGQFNNQLLFSFTSGTRRFYHSPELGGLNCLTYFLFPLSYLMETGAKNKRPQALPRAKESVMIPTLLMNIPEPANNTKSISVVALGFFPQRVSFFVLPVSLFYLLFAAWKKAEEIGLAYTIEDRGRKERKKGKKAPAWHRRTHTRACCGNY